MSWLPDSNAFGRPQRPSATPQNVTNAYFDVNVGFWDGVYHVLGRPALPTKAGIRVHLTLQRVADKGAPVVLWLGSQYLVLPRRPASAPYAGQPT